MHLKDVNSYLGIISIHNIIPAKILTLDDILRSHEYYHKTMYHVFLPQTQHKSIKHKGIPEMELRVVGYSKDPTACYMEVGHARR